MLKNLAPKARGLAVPRARRLRQSMSLPEVMLWRELRDRPGGLKFRRQHASGPYILDFFCSDARLPLEIDGEAHSRGERPTRDADRDEWFARRQIFTLRITAVDVMNNLEGVVAMVLDQAQARLPLHHPASPGGPPPRDKLGED